MLQRTLFLLLTLASVSCAVTSKVSTAETYRADGFSPEQINEKGIAILPITAGADFEGYRRPFGDALNETIDGLFEGVVGWNKTMEILNNAGLVSEYQAAIRAYNETAILDQSVMRKMTEALNVQYLLYVRLSPPENTSRTVYTAGSAVNVETRAVFASAKIWDRGGDVVWEGNSEAKAVGGAYSYIDESIAERCEKTAKGLGMRLRGLPAGQ